MCILDMSQDQQSQDQQSQDQQSQDQQSQEQQNQATDEDPRSAEQQAAGETEEQPLDEEQMSREQWLNRIPDDPAGLLKRKFQYQYSRRQRAPTEQRATKPAAVKQTPGPEAGTRAGEVGGPKKLSYKDQRELDQLPQRIEALDKELEMTQAALGDPDLYRQAPERVSELNRHMQALEDKLAQAYARWEALES